jgi:ureidoglycolate amidohydrolase
MQRQPRLHAPVHGSCSVRGHFTMSNTISTSTDRHPIDAAALEAAIEALARFSDSPYPAVTRVLFTNADLSAREFLKERYAAAGLAVREDAVGNTFARWPGTDPLAAPIATGSHTDAIPNAGRFDGVVGVLGGLEAIRALQRSGFRPRRSIDLIMFTAEEPTRFGLGCLGSRILGGTMSDAKLASLRDETGKTVEQVRASAGCRGPMASAVLARGAYAAFVELHIEQGHRLERAGVAIGVVTAIAAPATLRVRLSGEGGHAGTVLMPERHDPALAAAEIMLAVERAALATGNVNSVATCGFVQVKPGAVNSIARDVLLEIDVRDIELARRDAILRDIQDAVRAAAQRRGCPYTEELLNADPPATCDPAIVRAIGDSAHELGLSCQEMISRAYHDSLFMALVCPTSMIFVPSKDGISHRPDEYTAPADIANGVRVLAATLRKLAA